MNKMNENCKIAFCRGIANSTNVVFLSAIQRAPGKFSDEAKNLKSSLSREFRPVVVRLEKGELEKMPN